jgi:hypothetical protein
MFIGNEEELFEALGHNCRENMCSPFVFQNIGLDFLFQKLSLIVGEA